MGLCVKPCRAMLDMSDIDASLGCITVLCVTYARIYCCLLLLVLPVASCDLPYCEPYISTAHAVDRRKRGQILWHRADLGVRVLFRLAKTG